jgi:hypothetical protein
MISKEQLKLDLVGGISIGNSGKMESRESHIIYLGHRSLSYKETFSLDFLSSYIVWTFLEKQVEIANCFGI